VVLQRGQSLITTEGDEMKLTRLVMTDQVTGHGEGNLVHWRAFIPAHPSQKTRKIGRPLLAAEGFGLKKDGPPALRGYHTHASLTGKSSMITVLTCDRQDRDLNGARIGRYT
jgi:hypothetical protein